MPRKLALIIGNSDYDDSTLAKLKAPEADVGALADLLRAPDIGGFDHVATLVNSTFAEVHPAIAAFFADKRPDDLLLLYFSGHGVLDAQGRLFLGLKNTQRTLLSGSAIASTFVRDEMDSSRSRRQVLILDCCHSGAFARGGKGALGAQTITDATFEGHGRVVLTATDTMQYAWEGDQIVGETENSLFTHFVIEGLKTGAADTDGDGRITPDELYEFVFGRIVSATSKQKPRKIVYDQQGELVIARNPNPPRPKPAELLLELQQAIKSPLARIRAGAVEELSHLLRGSDPAAAQAARQALEKLKNDDSLSVRNAAVDVLAGLKGQALPAGVEPAPAPRPKREVKPSALEQATIRKSERKPRAAAPSTTEPVPAQRVVTPLPAKTERPAVTPAAPYESKLWWGLAVGLIAACIAGAFLVDWLLRWSLEQFQIVPPRVEWGWVALVIVALIWGAAYLLKGVLEETDALDAIFHFLTPYADIFDGYDPGERLRGLLTAPPFNILFAWGAAQGVRAAALALLGTGSDGIVYLVFGLITAVTVFWYFFGD